MEMDLNASFEDEMLAMNPEYDLIFSKCDEDRRNLSPQFCFEQQRQCPPDKMKIISQMNKLTGLKPLGYLATHKDWDNTDSTENETIALMRKMGIEPSIDQPPDERRTISTVPVNDDIIVNRNGKKRMQVFLGNSYFTLQPRAEPSSFSDEEENSKEISSNDVSTSDCTESSYMYQPISTDDTDEAEFSEESFKKDKEKGPSNNESRSKYSSSDSWRTERLTNNNGSSSRFSRRSTASESSSNRNNNWWRSANSSVEKRDENNWRISATKPVKEIEQKVANVAIKESRTTKTCSSKPVRKKQPTITSQEPITTRNCKSITKPPLEEQSYQRTSQEPNTTRNCKSITKPTLEEQPHVRNSDSINKPKLDEQNQPKISNCRSPLMKPKELFLRKRALLIQQVLAANQS